MKTAFMFSGQGAQYIGMGKEFYDNFPICKDIFHQADQTLHNLGFKISDLCFGQSSVHADDLNKTEFTQPAILTTSIATLKLLEQINMKPDYVLGLSLGEYSALVASGAFDFNEAVALVRKRGRFMTDACPEGVGAMSAIMNLDRSLVEEACKEASAFGIVSPANYNMPGQIVIAGETDAVAKAEILAKEKGARKCIRLNDSGAFHTALLKPASVQLNEELKKMQINEMQTPVITNLTGDFIHSPADIIPTLTQQVMSPVMWEDSILKLISLGVDTFIEIGPGKTLSSFVKKINKEVTVCNIENMETYEKFLSMNLMNNWR